MIVECKKIKIKQLTVTCHIACNLEQCQKCCVCLVLATLDGKRLIPPSPMNLNRSTATWCNLGAPFRSVNLAALTFRLNSLVLIIAVEVNRPATTGSSVSCHKGDLINYYRYFVAHLQHDTVGRRHADLPHADDADLGRRVLLGRNQLEHQTLLQTGRHSPFCPFKNSRTKRTALLTVLDVSVIAHTSEGNELRHAASA